MKPSFLANLVVFVVSAVAVLAGPRQAQWDEVKAAVNHGLPKTAIERLDPIIAGALADKAYAEAIQAIGQKATLQSTIQGNKSEEKIRFLEAELEKAPAAVKPMLETLLAHGYWQYYQQNRWRFLQRTGTTVAPGSDLQTWDLARILGEIDRHYTSALANEAVLQATPITEYADLLQSGTAPDNYRPTLYDFLVYDALAYYQMGEQGPVVAETVFELDAATTPVLADAEEFIAWHPAVGDHSSPKLKAIQLYQSLLCFHQDDVDRSAYLDAELARLNFGVNLAVGEDKDERYKAALRRFIQSHPNHEIFARASAALALRLHWEGKLAEAHEIAQRGLTAFPESAGGAECFNLLQRLEAKSIQLETEAVWNAPWPTLDVTYRNVTRLYLRVVPVNFEDEIAANQWNNGRGTHDRKQSLLKAKPALEWSVALPPTIDYEEHTHRLPAPTELKPGCYLIFASPEPSFADLENMVSVAPVWVSNLALVLQLRNDLNWHSGFVLDANTGAPVNDAVVRIWIQKGYGWTSLNQTRRTDENGRFEFSSQQGTVVIVAEHEGQRVANLGPLYLSRNKSHTRGSQTVLFTDRSLYRPGQTINYKGVAIRFDQDAGKYASLAGHETTVVFKDTNGKEITRAVHHTNDYGSFNGIFTAPHDRLMGSMTLEVVGASEGEATIHVEEYKRPKFQVELPPPTSPAKLDQPVILNGKALAYTGASIDGAKVQWRVDRVVQLPSWCWWWRPPARQAISHGTTTTLADGSFPIQFSATPDHNVPATHEPVFGFLVHVDVTDGSGETRSEERVIRAGYTALQAELTADDWQTPERAVTLKIATTSLDGDPQTAEGKIQIFALKQPAKVPRASLEQPRYFGRNGFTQEPTPDPSNPDAWELGEPVVEQAFQTDADGKKVMTMRLGVGLYRASLETHDRFGKKVTARHTIQVIDPKQSRYPQKLPDFFAARKWSVEPGETFTALWGTGYASGRAFVEVECNGKLLKSYWTSPTRTQSAIELPVTEKLRGGFTLRTTYVRENRAYLNERIVDVPWSNQQLSLKWERFRSKLRPGQRETWTAIVTGPKARRATAEMVATLYDASLDQFAPHDWPRAFEVFREERERIETAFQNAKQRFEHLLGSWTTPFRTEPWTYRSFPNYVLNHGWGWQYTTIPDPAATSTTLVNGEEVITLSPFMVTTDQEVGYSAMSSMAGTRIRTNLADRGSGVSEVNDQFLLGRTPARNKSADTALENPSEKRVSDLSQVTARKNLNETSFFFPRLLSDRKGVVKLEFTVPEALTEWKFLGFAHDPQLRSAYITERVITAKELMVQPNPPRFLREGDVVEFSVKVSNQSDQPQRGTVRLSFADAASLAPVDEALGNRVPDQAFEVPAKQSRSYAWRIAVPDRMDFLTYKAVAATAQFSDGEEGFLPVLSNRILVTESLPLPIRGKSTKPFEFKKLLASSASDTLRHQALTVQMTSQPAWYAVMALPYLMEFPYECSEQVFSRLYANALARHIANSDPKIRRVFDLWKNSPALDSPLEKNQELKALMLEETPWIRQAKVESEARKNLGVLFDQNRLEEETAQTLRKLSERQLADGRWSWFPGGLASDYISLYVMTGFGRLQHLGVHLDQTAAIKSLGGIDAEMTKEHDRIVGQLHPETYVLSPYDALYLYGRSFYLKDYPLPAVHQATVDFLLQQARKFWLQMNSRQSQAHLALALQRFGDAETAQAIMRSLKERSVHDEELGRFWRETEQSWWWHRAPIETQALMIEAFAEVTNDAEAVEDCKVWLLKQKQTQDWKTTKATSDAIYALLLRGENLLASDARVEVALDGKTIRPEKTEVGTGFYEQKFSAGEIKADLGHITVKKVDNGVSWGSVHWQYLEDAAKVTPHEGTPLTLKKTLFVKENTAKGPVLRPLNGPLAVGDELVVRIELRTDRDMEYVHLKDQRGSGTEPVNVLSGYRHQDGLAYYEMTRDTATHRFIDYLPKGVYVFEYSTRVQLKGRYQTGIAEVQCMYAPEFNSHSESVLLEVK